MPTLPDPMKAETSRTEEHQVPPGPTPVRTVPGVAREHAGEAIGLLCDRLVSLLDLSLTLKHVHWNVVGSMFLAVHERLDEHVADVRDMADETAERIRTLGGVPIGTPGWLVEHRRWQDYDLAEAPAEEHLRALDVVYEGIVLDHRRAAAHIRIHDPVSEALLIDQTGTLEFQQWFIRSMLRGTQPDARRHTFGSADRDPTEGEEATAERVGEVSDRTRESYETMARVGANVRGEGAIS